MLLTDTGPCNHNNDGRIKHSWSSLHVVFNPGHSYTNNSYDSTMEDLGDGEECNSNSWAKR